MAAASRCSTATSVPLREIGFGVEARHLHEAEAELGARQDSSPGPVTDIGAGSETVSSAPSITNSIGRNRSRRQ